MMVPTRTASNPTEHPDEDLRERFLRVSLRWQLAQYEMVSLAAMIEETGAWVGYAPSCVHWIAGALDMELCTAREWIRVGKALHDLPYLDAAFDSGLSYSKIRVLTRVATRENERELLELAYETPAGKLGPVLAKWLGDREDPAETCARQRRARSVSWWIEPDGMVHGNFRLPATEGKQLTAAIDTLVRRAHLGGAPGNASADASDPWPSIVQQRADALVALITGGGTKFVTEVVLHLRGDGATFDDGTPIPWPDLEALLPESFVRALIHDADRRPINASGRQRHPTARQKAVVLEAHGACVDCGSTDFLEFDHDPPYTRTGRTVVDELVPRCWPCHRRRHDGLDAA
jgi:5-methylcytosine-specific restriction endonuclease McrA